jgi:hypothetical protein
LSDCPVFLPINFKNLPVPPKSILKEEPATRIFFHDELKTAVRIAKNDLSEARLRMLCSAYLIIKASLAKADLNEPLGIFSSLFQENSSCLAILLEVRLKLDSQNLSEADGGIRDLKQCIHRY